jgi:5-methylcytosine-specific restriction protein A
MKDWAKSFYKSKAWRDCRDAYFISKHGLCERCGRPGKIVHHKKYLTPENINDPYITLSFENLELMCQDCHNREHMSGDVTAEGLCFNEHGELVVDNPKKSANNI